MTIVSPTDGPLTDHELQLATRNKGMPLEGLRYDITPTGMHYLLVHFDIPDIDVNAWSLAVDGCVDAPLRLDLAALRGLPAQTHAVTLECAGNGRARLHPRPISQPWLIEAVGTARWTGVSLGHVLKSAGLTDDARYLVFHGADHGVEKGREHDYARSLSVADAMRPEVTLAYAMNDHPLEPQHGAPLRLIVPGWYGMTHVKWLTRIEAVREPFAGYQQAIAYRVQDRLGDAGAAVTRMRPRALLIPPGFPDFLTRHRTVERGTVVVRGRAWSGNGEVTRVELGVGGAYVEATLEPAVGPYAWRGWSAVWAAEPGDHELTCRATDAIGAVQPEDAHWNLQGMENNQVQRVALTVR